MCIIRIAFLIGTLLSPVLMPNIYSQKEQTVKQMFVEAESYFLFEEYKDALPFYQRILRVEPENYNVIYKIGICYLNDIYQKTKSIKYFEQAAEHINMDYKLNTYREKGAPLEVLFYLGKAYRVNYMLDEAIKSFQRFKNLANPEEFDIELVDYEIASCQLAKEMKKHPVYFREIKPDQPVNSTFSETNPIISGDGNSLVFTRQLQFYQGVFITSKDKKGKWSEPYNLTPDFGLDGNSLATGISYAGDEIYVYRSDNFDGNIYVSKKENKNWGKLQKLNDNINTKFWESHASPSPDGKYLYFTSNRSGSYGGLDIFRSKRGKNDQWGTAFNLGPVINTPFNEEAPYVTNDGNTIFFNSQGHKTMGGYDIFISTLQGNGQWSEPQNMGYPLSTADDDLYFSPSGINSYGYLSRYNASSTTGLTDIYLVEVFNDLIPRNFTLKGKVNLKDASSEIYKNLRARLLKKGTNELISESKISEDGTFTLNASQGSYILLVEGDGIQPYMQSIDLNVSQTESLIALQTILLEQAGEGAYPTAAVQPVKQVIMAKSTFYAVNDSSPVKIELTLPKDAQLHVDITQNNVLTDNENMSPGKKKYIYEYIPKPGDNLLKFTSVDPDGNISTTEVMVRYYPKEDLLAADTISPVQPSTPKNGIFSILTADNLKEYMQGLNMDDYSDIYALYQHLLSVADQQGFSKEDVNKMFAVYFTQKDLNLFENEFRKQVTLDDSIAKLAKDSSSIPLQYIERLLNSEIVTEFNVNSGLIELMDVGQVGALGVIEELNLYAENKYDQDLASDKALSEEDGFGVFKKNTSEENARNALYLAATSEDLEYFRQNLILASDGALRKYITGLDLSSNNIYTSIDLVSHLFDNVDKQGYTSQELIKALELAAANKQYFLNKLKDLLAYKAEGTLKSQLQILNTSDENIYSFNGLIDYLLENSEYKNYKRDNVYQLLLDLIGIDNVEEFAIKIRSFNDSRFNKALDDTTVSYFSNPLELVEYLLVSRELYDFTDSDINNLLLRMILEKGLSIKDYEDTSSIGKKLFRNPKFVSTLVLVNILLIILIIFFYRRSKNNPE